MEKLGKLSKVDVRKIWEHEARDFSAWLVKEENLALLSEELGIQIEPIGTEENAGRFRVDILAKDSTSGDYIIIENQLEPSNHDHLGKVITYAAGYDAKYLIWIVKDVLDEHQKAIDWLNEHLDSSISCFLIKIEVWQIGDSKPAPRFEVISLKNNWATTLKNTLTTGEVSANQLKQQEFWRALTENFRQRDPNMRMPSPRPQHWMNFTFGSSVCHPYLTINSRENFVSCDLWTTNKEFLSFLQSREDDLRPELSNEFTWWEGTKSGGIRAKFDLKDVYDENEQAKAFDWLFEAVKQFQVVFAKYVKEFKSFSKQ